MRLYLLHGSWIVRMSSLKSSVLTSSNREHLQLVHNHSISFFFQSCHKQDATAVSCPKKLQKNKDRKRLQNLLLLMTLVYKLQLQNWMVSAHKRRTKNEVENKFFTLLPTGFGNSLAKRCEASQYNGSLWDWDMCLASSCCYLAVKNLIALLDVTDMRYIQSHSMF